MFPRYLVFRRSRTDVSSQCKGLERKTILAHHLFLATRCMRQVRQEHEIVPLPYASSRSTRPPTAPTIFPTVLVCWSTYASRLETKTSRILTIIDHHHHKCMLFEHLASKQASKMAKYQKKRRQVVRGRRRVCVSHTMASVVNVAVMPPLIPLIACLIGRNLQLGCAYSK
ncbi:uncharacterized protein F4807DRAFT_365862 [Annulohypoxylon truncatum]|uniref:uncharacterized protein n=1 Tax=Annulohypoxylon truncatum TaxID=327061 RepID=UPI002007F10D|nr:uncharacterized protein F4807DRAFT_365862 [Annulohypoxylon truncatum]KAI1212301.1 hypothetical protein F4807DRAFT_365862 [Annulohypoxylon truncatum]